MCKQHTVDPDEIAKRAAAVGLSFAELARLSGRAVSTLHRWRKRKHGININTYGRIMEVLLEAERNKGIPLLPSRERSARSKQR
jgi:predicted transcriptional regulator